MKISQKIHISFIFISILSVVLTAMLLTYIVEKNTKNVMEEQIKKQYVAIKETTKHQLSDYLNIIENEVLTLANLQMTRKAMERFFDAYKVLSASNETNLGEFQRLTEYYLNDFKSGFSRHDHDNMSPVDFMNKITPNQLFLQSMYVNPSPQMLSNDNKALPVLTKSNYVKTHEEFHFDLMGYQERFEFDDIYLIDRTGNIVYSVSKKIDFATNLLTGPLSKSGLGRVYQKAKTISKGDIVFQDFSPYYPSHNTPSSFIATPIMETNKLVGVLAFQLPLDHINSIMLHDANWDGFGKTGEIFLVSDDKSLRSQRRQLVENKVNYLEGLAKKGMSEQNIQKIADNNSSALYEKSQTEATKLALAGESGVGVFTNNRGEEFFSAYTPVSFFGESWAIISEIDYQEGVSSLEKISKELYTAAFYVMGIILFFAIVFSWILARGVSKPITLLSKKIGGIADKHDLSLRFKVVVDDEVKKLAEAVNSMLSDFQSVIKESDATIKVLTEASDQITNSLTMMQEEVENQAAKSSQCAAAITEMSSSIAQVASNAEAASESSESVVLSIQDSAYVGGELVDKINQLSAQMKQATESIDRLCAESSSIDIVLDVIQDIAEQTNLLALNAAIEAARAGEQGRGFTVVAAEVRTLATRTQSSTEQIRSKVEALQLETDKVVESIKDANLFVDTSVEHCVASNEKLDKVVTLMKRISEMNTEIATAANQQAGVTDSISENINKIVHYANEVVNQTHRTDDISRDINKQADTLSKQIGQFRIA